MVVVQGHCGMNLKSHVNLQDGQHHVPSGSCSPSPSPKAAAGQCSQIVKADD